MNLKIEIPVQFLVRLVHSVVRGRKNFWTLDQWDPPPSNHYVKPDKVTTFDDPSVELAKNGIKNLFLNQQTETCNKFKVMNCIAEKELTSLF